MSSRRTGSVRSRGGWGPTLAVIGGLGVVALAFVLVPRMLLPPPPTESASPTLSETATPAPQVSFAASPYLGIDWRLSMLPGGVDASVSSLVDADGRLVAVGSSSGSAAAWWSDDAGASWVQQSMERPEPPFETAVAEPRSVAAGPDGLIAIGFWYEPDSGEVLEPVGWTSRDGRAWEIAALSGLEDGSMLDDIFGTPDGFYATGFSQTRAQSWWYAADGVAWRAIEPFGVDQPLWGMAPIATSGDLVVLGSGSERGRSTHPAIYASRGWLNWERVYEADEDTYGLVWGMTAFDEGFVAVGVASQESDWQRYGHAAAWLSNDGYGWQELDLDAAPESGAAIVAANADGAVATGWSNADGSQRSYFLPYGGTPSSIAIPFSINGIVALPGRFVALGSCIGDTPCGVVVAIGTPTASAVTVAPTLPPLPN